MAPVNRVVEDEELSEYQKPVNPSGKNKELICDQLDKKDIVIIDYWNFMLE